MRLLLAAGGTAGHVFPALALAAVAQREGHDTLLLGAEGGMEARLADGAGVPFVGVPAGKWDRQRPDPRQALRALQGLGGAIGRTRRWRPDVAIGFGGFASFPGCVGAVATRTPLVLHEGNALPGRVTRLFARRAAVVALAWPEAAARLPRARRHAVVGQPVREVRVSPAEARATLGLPAEGPVTLVMGGSQGSVALNAAVPAAYRQLREELAPARLGSVLHAAGSSWREGVSEVARDLPGYVVDGFVDATLAWSAADLAITRAGVGTLADAAFHEVPLVMVPLPTSAEDHQRHNARAVAASGGGHVVAQDDPEGLRAAWRALLDPGARADAARAMSLRSPAGAAERLYALVSDTVRDAPRGDDRGTADPERGTR